MLEVFKIVAALLGGGLAGAFVNQWFLRKTNKLQRIQLIERVNRVVSPQLEGITLARVIPGLQRHLEQLENLREYQLTLRNTSTVHLQDVEIQFEFPSGDTQAWVSRPALSKTALIDVDADPKDQWKKAFRWRIPHLPSGDSVEFTFQAVNPPSASYEVSLYKNDRVIIEKLTGEPVSERGKTFREELRSYVTACAIVLVCFGLTALGGWPPPDRGLPATVTINAGGCNLTLVSEFYGLERPFGRGSWDIINRITNFGGQPCVIQSAQIENGSEITIAPRETVEKTRSIKSRPEVAEREIQIKIPGGPTEKIRASIYIAK